MNENGWKSDLWSFFAASVGFWISKPNTSRAEKVGVGIIVLMVVILTVFL